MYTGQYITVDHVKFHDRVNDYYRLNGSISCGVTTSLLQLTDKVRFIECRVYVREIMCQIA